MYAALLLSHSWLRWPALAGVVLVFLKELRAMSSGAPWKASDLTWMKGAAHLLTAQVAIGIVLYATSPYVRGLLTAMSATMHDRIGRFFAVEHGFTMLLAVAATHMAAALAAKGTTDRAKHRRAAICFGMAGLLLVYAIPWWRPLLRMGM